MTTGIPREARNTLPGSLFASGANDKRQKQEDYKKAVVNLKPEEVKRVIESLTEEQMRLAAVNTIKFIKDSKPGKPGGDMVGAAPPPGREGRGRTRSHSRGQETGDREQETDFYLLSPVNALCLSRISDTPFRGR